MRTGNVDSADLDAGSVRLADVPKFAWTRCAGRPPEIDDARLREMLALAIAIALPDPPSDCDIASSSADASA